jgi:hypothetical protein
MAHGLSAGAANTVPEIFSFEAYRKFFDKERYYACLMSHVQ